MRRYAKVDLQWYLSEWVCELPGGSKAAWMAFIPWVKASGYGGTAKALPATVLSSLWFMPAQDIQTMLDAAIKHGAIRHEDGNYTVTKWPEYQDDHTAAERQKRYRQRKQESTQDDVTPRNDRNVTVERKRERERERKGSIPLSSPENASQSSRGNARGKTDGRTDVSLSRPSGPDEVYDFSMDLEEFDQSYADTFWEKNQREGWQIGGQPIRDWKLAFEGWLKSAKVGAA